MCDIEMVITGVEFSLPLNSGSLANNKNIRKYKKGLARITTQAANLSDVLTRLWIKSNPIIGCHHRVVKCSFCGEEHNARLCPKKKAEQSI